MMKKFILYMCTVAIVLLGCTDDSVSKYSYEIIAVDASFGQNSYEYHLYKKYEYRHIGDERELPYKTYAKVQHISDYPSKDQLMYVSCTKRVGEDEDCEYEYTRPTPQFKVKKWKPPVGKYGY